MAAILPEGFEQLTPFVDHWALETQSERENRRRTSTGEEMQAFFDAVFPEIERMLGACDKFPFGSLPPSHQPLLNMALTLAEIAPSVEHYDGASAVPHSFEETRFIAEHADHPTWKG